MRNNKGQFIKGFSYSKGVKRSEETRKKISEYVKNNPQRFWLGKKRDEKTRLAMKNTQFKREQPPWNKDLKGYMAGEKNPAWKGGHSARARRKFWATRPMPEQCEICGVFGRDLKKGLCFDHDHMTGKFRGWICGRCNIALGMVKDNTEILLTMIEYINKLKREPN